ncbi:MAG: acyltransferase family protein [Pleurocapsa sp.]
MTVKQRLWGIDLVRGIAIFGEIILHSDLGETDVSWTWLFIRDLFAFAVPFFLATSFYLTVSKSKKQKLNFQLRLKRLLIPYFVWTLIYLVYKFSKYIVNGEFSRLNELWQDPFKIIFCGGAAFHLYFLPLLIFGILIIKIMEVTGIKKLWTFSNVTVALFVCLLAYELSRFSNNAFDIEAATAFNNLSQIFLEPGIRSVLLRLALVSLGFALWCLPYILMAILLNINYINKLMYDLKTVTIIGLLVVFLGLSFSDTLYRPTATSELFRGYIALILGINASKYLKKNNLIANLSACSFGIYFIHLIFVELSYIVGDRLVPNMFNSPSTALFIAIALISLGFSWLATNILLGYKAYSKWLFGV